MMKIWLVVLLAFSSRILEGGTLLPPRPSTLASAEVVGTEIAVSENKKPTRISHPGATYISVFLENIRLGPGDSLTVRSKQVDGRSETLTTSDVPKSRSHWSIAILGEADADGRPTNAIAFIDLINASKTADYTVNVYAAGLTHDEVIVENQPSTGFLEICGDDQTKEARCFESDTQIYSRSRAVARLLINGKSACTGWLVGSEGHLLTNQHCVGSAADADNLQVEMMAEGASCQKDCNHWFACPGTVVATRAKLLKVDAARDFALLKLSPAVAMKYGYLKLRRSGPKNNERIYIPQHPRGSGKRIAVRSTEPEDMKGTSAGFTHVNSLTEWACGGSVKDEAGYQADTDPGASGSPVIAFRDHAVVALHHCGGCPNRGVPIDKVVSQIGKLLPASAFAK